MCIYTKRQKTTAKGRIFEENEREFIHKIILNSTWKKVMGNNEQMNLSERLFLVSCMYLISLPNIWTLMNR